MKKILLLIMVLLTSLSVVACKNEVNYTVTFETNGGSEVQPIIFNKENQKINEPVVTRDGYSLEGWFRESDFRTKWNFLVDVVESDITLYAKWSEVDEVNYTVTFETNGGTDVLPVVITENNQKISQPSVSRDGYSLEGWFREKDFSSKWNFLVDVVESDITLYAKWSEADEGNEVNYTVTFVSNGGTEVPPVVVTEDNQKISEPSVSKDGYSLEGWFKESDFTTKWNFLVDVVESDITLYAKWSEDEDEVVDVPTKASIVNLTGAALGGDMNDFPSNENLGSRTTIERRERQSAQKRSTFASPLSFYNNGGMLYKSLETQEDSLYIYFNWDGSFNWLEDYTFTVDTSRSADGQGRQYFNLRDYYDIEDYEVFVNYIRYRVNTVDGEGNPVEKVYYEGDAMVESSSGSSFILNQQSISFNDNGTPEDGSDDSYDIAIGRNDIDSALMNHLKNDPDATLDIIGIQLFIAHRGKLLNYWGPSEEPDHTVYRDGDLSIYVLQDPIREVDNIYHGKEGKMLIGSGKSIVSYYAQLGTSPEIPQNIFGNYHGENVTEFSDYLGLIKVFYSLESEEVAGDTVYLEQNKIEFAGGSKVPYIGLNKDLNESGDDSVLYYSIPVQANTNAVYDRENLYDIGFRHIEFDFMLFITLKEGVEYSSEWTIEGVEYTMTGSDYNPDTGEVTPVESKSLITSHLLPSEPSELIAVYAVTYNNEIINLLDNSIVVYPGTSEPVKANLKHSANWIYQGNIPFQLPEGITVDDVIVTEGSQYSYTNYNFDLEESFEDESLSNAHRLHEELYSDPEYRRNTVGHFLTFYYSGDLINPEFIRETSLLPENMRYYSGNSYFNDNGDVEKSYFNDDGGGVEIGENKIDARGRLSNAYSWDMYGNKTVEITINYLGIHNVINRSADYYYFFSSKFMAGMSLIDIFDQLITEQTVEGRLENLEHFGVNRKE